MRPAPNDRAERWLGLHVLADDDPRWPISPVEQARAACAGGASVVQLRAKHATDRRALEWGRAIRECTRDAGIAFVVNDRFDLALLCEADGVHLGQDDFPPGALPREAQNALAIGLSTHDLDQAKRALAAEPDYVAFGPLFGTTSKETGYEARGLAALAEIARAVAPRPLVAIGGIDAERIGAVARAGVGGVAVISAVAEAADPTAATRDLVATFEGARVEGALA